MKNFEAFISDYMEYRSSFFSVSQTTTGVAAILAAAGGGVLGVFGLIKLGLIIVSVSTSVIPGINALLAPLGIYVSIPMIKYGVMALARDDSWSRLDKTTRMNIIAGIVFFKDLLRLIFQVSCHNLSRWES